jgi:F-type H+-transporting ATPase subunit delta
LLELAVQSKQAERLRGELSAAAELLDEHAELREALTHPVIVSDKKRAVVESLWGDRASPLLIRLLALLAARNRIGLLPAIASAFGHEWNQRRGVLSAEATAAIALDDDQTAALREAIQRATGSEIELSVRVDPSVLGGIRLSVAGRVYDGSVRGRLQALRQHLGAEAPAR